MVKGTSVSYEGKYKELCSIMFERGQGAQLLYPGMCPFFSCQDLSWPEPVKSQFFSSPSFLHFTNISSSNYAIGSHFSEVERKVAIVHLDNDISAR